MGHDAITLPMYLPLTLNRKNSIEDTPVFYGAVNIYLKQQFPLFRHIPGWMEKLLDSGPVLKFAAHKSGSTRAQGLERLTESMLLGENGFQRHELDRLVRFLRDDVKPDVVHFSNALLMGLARRIREEVKAGVVVSLQDEDVWVDAMEPEWRGRIWDLIAEKGRDVDAFVAVSAYYAGIMQAKMGIPSGKLNIAHIGVRPENYSWTPPANSPPAIGYLSRIGEENGFGILVDAFILLKKDPQFRHLVLKATGGMTGDDLPFLRRQQKKLGHSGLLKYVDIAEDFSPRALKEFFRSLSVLSVPVLKGEAFGLYQVEALASGVPLVQPDLGAFPEIIHATGGGIVYHPNTAEALASALGGILSDRAALEQLSIRGRMAVEEDFDCRKLTAKIVGVYEKIKS